MGVATSLLVFAVGAILTWGVTDEPNGVNLDAIGVILMIVALVGLVVSLLFWSSWGGYGVARRRTVVDRGYDDDVIYREAAPRRRERVVEEPRDVDVGPPGPGP